MKTLTDTEIEELLNLAINNQSEALLLILAGLGTVEDGSHVDYRDSRIELAIINKALAMRQTHTPSKRRIIYGLSGNPPTLNHKHFIKHLLCDGKLVTVILNAQSPLKPAESYVPAELRFEMLMRMMSDLTQEELSRCCFSRLEIDRPPPSRMAVTMSLLVLLSKGDEQLELVLGLDALPSFNQWEYWIELAKLCQLKFYPRQGESIDTHLLIDYLNLISAAPNIHLVFNTDWERNQFLADAPHFSPNNTSIDTISNISEGSASAARRFYKEQGENVSMDELPDTIDKNVHELIIQHRLYRRLQ